eukprot:CAMPEP_0117744268 /NCGR_PEP_ID=MMETSP0947-20121206/6650_1 /TAXON_ID=44440 /ORGANISM="Chattonella subsalsa, Strain CCMP2191" /LENGTH=326 /DNA_ID=CAMNT_0005561169 /DNA_START=228 /DNA_END=1208 /DNA_ORIENTATION=+
MTRKQYWGKKDCKVHQKSLPSFFDTLENMQNHDIGSQILLHPLSQLRWLSTGASFERNLPSKTPWEQINSAARAMSLKIDWSRVLKIAQKLDDSCLSKAEFSNISEQNEKEIVNIFKHPDGGWQVADGSSLEVCIAHALLDQQVQATVVSYPKSPSPAEQCIGYDKSKFPTEHATKELKSSWHGSLLLWPSPSNLSIDEGWTLISRSGSRAVVKMCPTYVMCSRDLESCTWPKVWHFIKMAHCQDNAKKRVQKKEEDLWVSLPPIPLKWSPEAQRWESGNRHRVMASLICNIPFRAEIRTKQIVSWKYVNTLKGENLKSPGRYWEL